MLPSCAASEGHRYIHVLTVVYRIYGDAKKITISASHRFLADHDDYSVMMIKALADRLAEVCSYSVVFI